jgi:hypothetical protein
MRPSVMTRLAVLVMASLPVLFAACVKDSCKQIRTYTWYEPIYKSKDEVRANIKSNPAKDVKKPGKLYIRGNYIFLNDVDKGIHIIDNSNPSSPQNIAFIDIPGNLDIAVKGNTLYADLYSDLITLDITNPLQVQVKKINENIFPYRNYGGGFVPGGSSNQVIVDWKRKDTTVNESCDNQGWWGWGRADMFLASSNNPGSIASGGGSPVGQGGSMARFTIMNDRLYTVGMAYLDVFNITNSIDPFKTASVPVGWNIETIFPFQNKLFIGSVSGMFIYDVNNPDAPIKTGQFSHITSCDPVIADANYAYVTLRSGTTCQGFTNQMDVLQLNGTANPQLLKTYEMKNPKGLSKDGDILFLCDDGLKIYNASNVQNLQLIKHIKAFETFDVIAYNNIALVVANDGLYQYDYSNINNLRLLSRILVNQ